MRKYFNEEGKEVKFGDIISVKETETIEPFGEMTITSSVVFNEGMQDDLEAAGWITHEDSINEDVDYYLNKVAKKIFTSEYATTSKAYFKDVVKTYLKRLCRNYPELVVTILVKEVAKDYSRMHKDSLFHYKEVWGVNKNNTKQVLNLGKPTVDMIANLSVFRSCSEAQKAAEIVENIIKYIHE